jgi:hypothetical protein
MNTNCSKNVFNKVLHILFRKIQKSKFSYFWIKNNDINNNYRGKPISPKVFCQKILAILANSAILAHSAIWEQKQNKFPEIKNNRRR